MINFCAHGKDWKELFTFWIWKSAACTHNAQKHFQFPTSLVAAKIVT